MASLPDQAQAAEGAHACLITAQEHLQAAQSLSEHTLWGMAIAHLILSLEEAVKARVLGAVWLHHKTGWPLGFTPAQVRSLVTRSHKKRHGLAFLQALSMDDSTAIMLFGQSPSETGVELLEWLSQADELKQQGMYTDQTDIGWQRPGLLPQSEYERAASFVEPFVRDTRQQQRIAGL